MDARYKNDRLKPKWQNKMQFKDIALRLNIPSDCCDLESIKDVI
jgi:hypothetical protein